MNPELKQKAREYSQKIIWNGRELIDSMRVQQKLRFLSLEDLDFEVLDFFYDKMLSQILRDAHQLSLREGYHYAYSWGKAYLNHYAGHNALVSSAEHPAIHTPAAYDLLIDRLVESCSSKEKEVPDEHTV